MYNFYNVIHFLHTLIEYLILFKIQSSHIRIHGAFLLIYVSERIRIDKDFERAALKEIDSSGHSEIFLPRWKNCLGQAASSTRLSSRSDFYMER